MSTAKDIALRRGRARVLNPYWLLLAPVLGLLGIFYIYPLLSVLSMSVTQPYPGIENFTHLIFSPGPRKIILNTFRICLITTAISVMVSYALACVIMRVSARQRQVMIAVILMSLWISVLIRAFSWLILLSDHGLVNNFLIYLGVIHTPLSLVYNQTGVVIGMVHYLLPYAVLPLLASMRAIDPALMRASYSLGAKRIRTFILVFMPLSLPGVAAACVIVFVFSLGFYITPSILGGGRVVMLSEYISVSVLQELRWGFAAAQAVTLLGLTVLVLGIGGRLLGSKRILPS